MRCFAIGVFTTIYLIFLGVYGYTYSLTAGAFPVQGWIGTLVPVILGGLLFAGGWLLGSECKPKPFHPTRPAPAPIR